MEYHSGGSLPLLGRPRYCPGANANRGYLCETGHCCGETGCCTYYYELWWFWLLWTVLILFSCCCAYRHRRAKLRVQQQQRQRDISLLAYHGASSYPSSMLDLSFLASLKLPSYEEVAAQPSTPPPPYSSVFTAPRYPQPPRTADPHLLTQHGPLLHQALSDGPSSLSSDNSSSCSCDSCCPSSPCSSSLSAPVTYETDTSHASTPSEATAVALDHVTMETINAAASCLELHRARFSSERRNNSATVAIDIEETSPASRDNVTVAVVTGTTSPPLETTASPNSDAVLPVGITLPIKQQLDFKPTLTSPTSPQNPSNVTLPCVQSTEASRSDSPMTSPPASLTLPRMFDCASSPTSPKQLGTLTLILDSTANTFPDQKTTLVPMFASPSLSQNPLLTKSVLPAVEEMLARTSQESTSLVQNCVQIPDTNLSQASPASRTEHLIDSLHSPHKSLKETHVHLAGPVATDCHHSSVPSSTSQGTLNFSTNSSGEPSDLDVASHEVVVYLDGESPNKTAEMASQSLINAFADPKNHEHIFSLSVSTEMPELTKSMETTATNLTQRVENMDLQSFTESFGALVSSSLLPIPKAVPECFTTSSEALHSVQTKHLTSETDYIKNISISQSEITQGTRSPPNSATPNSGVTFQLDPVIHSPTSAQKLEPSQNPSSPSSNPSKLPEPSRAQGFCPELVPAPSDLDCSVFSPSHDSSRQVAFDNHKELNCQDHTASSLHPNSANPSLVLDSCLNSNVLQNMATLDISSASEPHTISPIFDQDRELESAVNLSPPNLPQQQVNDLKLSNSLRDSSGPCCGLPQSPSLNLEHSFTHSAAEIMPDSNSSTTLCSDAYSFCPTITIQADPLSCATSPSSPCSIPSPTLPSPPVSMLLLDPLAASMHSSEKSGASSGHASSLSPSPRNTQSPPKQTLFSPCVDVFEPVNPNWEDEEEEEQQDDEDYDDDMGADESQYRHRRLTGDSGIEVCRCQVEDEDDDDNDKKLQSEEDGDKSGGVEKKCAGSSLELHDSVDCPVRSQKSTGEEVTLYNSTSDTTQTSDDNVVISVETV